MEVAEAGEKPASLAGIPLDDTYAVAAAEQRMARLSRMMKRALSPSTREARPRDAGGVAVVLNDMFSLFEKKPVKKAAKPKNTKVAKTQDETLVLPGANADVDSESSFMEELFVPVEPQKEEKEEKIGPEKNMNVFD